MFIGEVTSANVSFWNHLMIVFWWREFLFAIGQLLYEENLSKFFLAIVIIQKLEKKRKQQKKFAEKRRICHKPSKFFV